MRRLRVVAVAVLAILPLIAGPAPARAISIDPCQGFGYTLCERVTVTVGGAYSGTVTSDPAGISCRYVNGAIDPTSTCEHLFRSYTVTSERLEVDAVPDMAGGGATCNSDGPDAGPCFDISTLSGIGTSYGVAVYFRLGRYTIGATPGTGGSATMSPYNLTCAAGTECLQSYDYGTSVTLTAIPAAGYRFVEWTGGCESLAPTCTFTVTKNALIDGYFVPGAAPSPTPSPRPTVRATATPSARPGGSPPRSSAGAPSPSTGGSQPSTSGDPTPASSQAAGSGGGSGTPSSPPASAATPGNGVPGSSGLPASSSAAPSGGSPGGQPSAADGDVDGGLALLVGAGLLGVVLAFGLGMAAASRKRPRP